MESFHGWWATVPEWAKPVILTASIGVTVGLLAWVLKSGIPAMIRWFKNRQEKRIRREVLKIREEAATAVDRQGTRTVSYEEYYKRIRGDRDLIRQIVDEEADAFRHRNDVQPKFRR